MDVIQGQSSLFSEHRRRLVDAIERMRLSEIELDEADRANRVEPQARESDLAKQRLPALRAAFSTHENAADELRAAAYEDVLNPDNFEELTRWFMLQAGHVGIPSTYLTAFRKPRWWRRTSSDWNNPPEPTGINGHVVTLRPKHGSVTHVLVTASGDVYKVVVDPLYTDPRARVIYRPPAAKRDLALRHSEEPEPRPELQRAVAAEIFHLSVLWRSQLHLDEPEAPWL